MWTIHRPSCDAESAATFAACRNSCAPSAIRTRVLTLANYTIGEQRAGSKAMVPCDYT